MADSHQASPNSEVSGSVSPESQNATCTVPSQIKDPSIASGQNDSEDAKIVKTSPGV